MAEKEKSKLSFNEVKFWLEEAESCKKRQEAELKKRNYYPNIIKYYEGEQYENTTSKKMAIINEYFPNVNALVSEIMYQNPDILAEALKPLDTLRNDAFNRTFPMGDISPDMVMKSALQHSFDTLDAITENRIALFDMIMAGYSAVEVNHINRDNIDVLPLARGSRDTIIGEIKNKIKKALGKDDVEEEIEKTIPIKEIAYSTPDETYLRRWNPLDILLDYRADRVKDLKYIIKVIRMSHAEFAARYPQFKDDIQADDKMLPYTQHTLETDKKVVTLYEYQVKQHDNKYINFVLSPTFKLREIDYFERPYITNGFNVKIGVLHEYGKLYPVSFGKVNKSMQDDINNYATFMMEVAERNIPKIGYDKTKVKDDGIRGLRSDKVNDLVPVEGSPQQHIHPIQPTGVSNENRELLGLFQAQKDKLWSVSTERLGGKGGADFATELQIQEAGFMSRQSDIQEGLRKLLRQELNTLKDIIVQFWDNEIFFKITGAQKPTWYEPQVAIDGTVLNPLSDILTWDYDIDVDITTSLKPNKERKKKELIDFATWITSPNVMAFLQMQGYSLDVEVIKKVAKEWGWNPENILKQIQQQPMGVGAIPGAEGVGAAGVPTQGVPSANIPI